MVVGSSPVAVTSDFAPASSKEFLDIQATIECGFALKHVRNMIRTYSQISCMLYPFCASFSCNSMPLVVAVQPYGVTPNLKKNKQNKTKKTVTELDLVLYHQLKLKNFFEFCACFLSGYSYF